MDHEKKLNVTFRLEPGCLGPQGSEHIEKFCQLAQKMVNKTDTEFVVWNIVPRHDKALSEIEYRINNKKLSHDKAVKYLNVFNKKLDEFEQNILDKLALYIDDYLGH